MTETKQEVRINLPLPDKLHRILKSEAALRGLTLREWIVQILETARGVDSE